jgi:hypothetical protein
MRRLLITLLLLTPALASAQESDTGPLFMKDLVGDREFFAPWGIGLDFYTMEQDYDIAALDFQLPGLPSIDTDAVKVSNDVQHYDLKLDVWLTPFINVFGILGRVDADTLVDLSSVTLPGAPVPLGVLPVSYDGTVYGLGLNLVYGTENWFVALNNTWTDTDLGGEFTSSVETFTSQPRIGLIRNKWMVWVGGMYLDTDERHQGTIQLPVPGLPPIPFDVSLETQDRWNYAVGIGHVFGPKAHISLELGFGDREHTLFNFTYRF